MIIEDCLFTYFLLSNPSNPHAMKDPITNATRYINGFPIVGTTKIPP